MKQGDTQTAVPVSLSVTSIAARLRSRGRAVVGELGCGRFSHTVHTSQIGCTEVTRLNGDVTDVSEPVGLSGASLPNVNLI